MLGIVASVFFKCSINGDDDYYYSGITNKLHSAANLSLKRNLRK